MRHSELKMLVGDRPFLWKWLSVNKLCVTQFISETEIVQLSRDGLDCEPIEQRHSLSDDDEISDFELISYFEEKSIELRCECGAESIGVGSHSHWCGKASVA